MDVQSIWLAHFDSVCTQVKQLNNASASTRFYRMNRDKANGANPMWFGIMCVFVAHVLICLIRIKHPFDIGTNERRF